MSSEFTGPIINKKRNGLGRTSDVNPDSIFAFMCAGVATTDYVLGTIEKFTQLSDAEDLGINAAYDATNKILVWNHIKRYFAYNPDGVIYFMMVAQGTTLAQMCDKANANNLIKLLTDDSTNREITCVGVVLNPDMATYTPTFATGLDADVIAALPKAQDLITTLAARAIYIDNILIEGRMNPTFSSSTLYNLRLLTDDGVSVVIAQDPVIAALDADYANYADVGSALGMRSVRKVSESLGSVDIANKPQAYKGSETYPLTRVADGFYLTAGLSCGKKFSELSETDKSNLAAKGYIYAGKFEGLDGYFFNDGHTCIAATDDYAYQEDNRVWNKAVRLLRSALLPVMKGEVEVDPTTGYLPPSVISYYETKGNNKLKQMGKASEVSGDPKVTISPNQDIVGTSTIVLSLAYVRKGILRKLEANVGAVKTLA